MLASLSRVLPKPGPSSTYTTAPYAISGTRDAKGRAGRCRTKYCRVNQSEITERFEHSLVCGSHGETPEATGVPKEWHSTPRTKLKC